MAYLKRLVRRIILELIWLTRKSYPENTFLPNVLCHSSGMAFKNGRLISNTVGPKETVFGIFHHDMRWQNSLREKSLIENKTVSFIGLSIWSNYYHTLILHGTRLHTIANCGEPVLLLHRGVFSGLLREMQKAGLTSNPVELPEMKDNHW